MYLYTYIYQILWNKKTIHLQEHATPYYRANIMILEPVVHNFWRGSHIHGHRCRDEIWNTPYRTKDIPGLLVKAHCGIYWDNPYVCTVLTVKNWHLPSQNVPLRMSLSSEPDAHQVYGHATLFIFHTYLFNYIFHESLERNNKLWRSTLLLFCWLLSLLRPRSVVRVRRYVRTNECGWLVGQVTGCIFCLSNNYNVVVPRCCPILLIPGEWRRLSWTQDG